MGLALVGPAVWAGEVVVQVSGIKADTGEIGCALFGDAKGFPMERANAKAVWQAASQEGVTCRFADVPPGRYGVAVSHDLNGNRKTDTRFFGIPTEDWGVSNNVRPRMRAPRFEEAAFAVGEGEIVTVKVKVGR